MSDRLTIKQMSKSLVVGKLTSDSATAENQLGTLRTEWSTTDSCLKTYKYVLTASDTTVANGTALGFSDTLGHTASLDCTDYDENQPLGVGIGVITAGQYGWVQTKGYHSAVLTNGDDDIADGDHVILDASTDGVVDSVAAGTAPGDRRIGVAVAADVDAGDTVAVMLEL